MKRYIISFSQSTKDVLSILDSHTDPCMDSLTQLWIFPDYPEYHQHWSQEVWNQLKFTKKLKSTKKFPTKAQIFENTFEDNKHIIPACINSMIEKESKLTPNPNRVEDVKGLTLVIKEYLSWVSDRLSSDGVITSAEETRSKLREIGILD